MSVATTAQIDVDTALRRSAAKIVVAYIGSHPIAADQLAIVVKSVLNALGTLGDRFDTPTPKLQWTNPSTMST